MTQVTGITPLPDDSLSVAAKVLTAEYADRYGSTVTDGLTVMYGLQAIVREVASIAASDLPRSERIAAIYALIPNISESLGGIVGTFGLLAGYDTQEKLANFMQDAVQHRDRLDALLHPTDTAANDGDSPPPVSPVVVAGD